MALRHANRLNTGRYFYTGCHKSFESTPDQICPDQIVLSVHLHPYGLQLLKVSHQVGPGNLNGPLIQSPLQIHLQSESQKTGNNVPHTLPISLMIDRSNLQRRLLLPKSTLHSPKTLISLCHFLSVIWQIILRGERRIFSE